MVQEEIRKGPWTEQEDFQLVCFVGLFGDRRWDFIAKVSGLNRTGKSCRLRWVNYLHPGLKRGKMTPQEEKLVVQLHSKWGNRWSRIARKLPGRTDNEIKNYWRTHMRKKAQENRRAMSSSSSSSNCSSLVTNNSAAASPPSVEKAGEESFYDTGGPENVVSSEKIKEQEEGKRGCQMEDFWNDFILSDEIENAITPVHDCFSEESCGFSCLSVASPTWNHDQDTKWNIIEESNLLLPMSDPFFPSCSHEKLTLDG